MQLQQHISQLEHQQDQDARHIGQLQQHVAELQADLLQARAPQITPPVAQPLQPLSEQDGTQHAPDQAMAAVLQHSSAAKPAGESSLSGATQEDEQGATAFDVACLSRTPHLQHLTELYHTI